MSEKRFFVVKLILCFVGKLSYNFFCEGLISPTYNRYTHKTHSTIPFVTIWIKEELEKPSIYPIVRHHVLFVIRRGIGSEIEKVNVVSNSCVVNA